MTADFKKKMNKEILDTLIRNGNDIIIMDHTPSAEELKTNRLGMSDIELIEQLIKHKRSNTLEHFISELAVNYYTKHCRLNDLSLFDE